MTNKKIRRVLAAAVLLLAFSSLLLGCPSRKSGCGCSSTSSAQSEQ